MTGGDGEPQALKSRLLADLVQAMSAGHLMQATTVAVLVGRTAPELVQQAVGAHDDADEQRLQRHLRNVVTLLSVAQRHFDNVLLAVHWYRTASLPHNPQHTPETLIAAGSLEEAYRMLLRTPCVSDGEGP